MTIASEVFSKGLQRPIDYEVGCGHTDHYESLGECVDGEAIYCSWCGVLFIDPNNPKDYSDYDDNRRWYATYTQSYFAVKENRACWWDETRHHRGCKECRKWNEEQRTKRNAKIRASANKRR